MPITLITTIQGKEHTAMEEIPDCLYRFDENVRVEAAPFKGVLKVYTSIPSREAARIIASCWTSHVVRIVPLDIVVEASLPRIVEEVVKLARERRLSKETVAVKCTRRGGRLRSSKEVEEEVGAALKNSLRLKVNLSNPDVLVRIEVLGDEAGIALLSREDLKPPRRVWPPYLYQVDEGSQGGYAE